jgi:dolichyl-phosphate beta-glucosyltransferase
MRLSLVIPAVDSTDVIPATVDSALRHVARYPGAEVVVVDDRAAGEMEARLEPLARDEGSLRVQHSQGSGTAAAVREGMLAAAGDFVVVTEADLSYPLAEIDHIVAALDDRADVAVATRFDRDSRLLLSPARLHDVHVRHIAHRTFNGLVHAALGLQVSDSLAALKGFRRAAAQTIAARQTIVGLAFHVELLFIAQRFGLTVAEIPVLYRPAIDRRPAKLAELFRALADVWRIRQTARRGEYR